ncbi:hypothetical protein BIV23_00920 [Streptomyces monashensis]|uniref:Uncharacterized protein n=1 Tax=Streptomyces monashensis TaxID=1678012 RepID=A0A1S2QPR3_9ACTN|nr:hypothetical protein BIV23_00920 [Streptomyces monashensis]
MEDADAERASTYLRSLADWLRYEEDLRGKTQLEHGEITPGQMGGLPEALVATLSTGGAATVLARAVVEWVRQRKSDVTVKAVKPDGETFEIDLRRVTAPEALVAELCKFLSPEQSGPDPDETA